MLSNTLLYLPQTSADTVEKIADEAMAELLGILKDDSLKLSPEDRVLIQAVLTDLSHVAVYAMATGTTATLAREAAHLTAQLANIAAARELQLGNAVGRAVSNILTRGIQIAMAALIPPL